jgi:hypothetical protein
MGCPSTDSVAAIGDGETRVVEVVYVVGVTYAKHDRGRI